MENSRAIIFSLVVILLAPPASLFAYEPTTAHRALTREVGTFYNEFNQIYLTPKLSDEDIRNMEKGAMGEDDALRMAHHFYDPIHDTGLKGYTSSKTWSQSSYYQANWHPGAVLRPENTLLYDKFDDPTDYSWQRAIYDYVYGDKARAMEGLGHTLHLIEDASVPDHTRDDAHVPIADKTIAEIDPRFKQESPFEKFTDRFSIEHGNVHTTRKLIEEGGIPHFGNSLNEYFDHAALFSNQNFFSKSTIFDSNYPSPHITSTSSVSRGLEEKFYVNFDNHPIAFVDLKRNYGSLTTSYDYSIPYDDEYLLDSYWQYSSRNAVTNGAGVVRLFFVEAEKERQTGALKATQKALVKKAGEGSINFIAYSGKAGARAVSGSIAWVGSLGNFAATNIASGISGSASQIASLFNGTQSPTALASTSAIPEVVPPTSASLSVAPGMTTPPTPPTSPKNDPKTLALLVSRLIEARKELDALAATAAVANATAPEVLGASTSTPSAPVVQQTTTTTESVRIDYGSPQGSAPDPNAPSVVTPPSPPPPAPPAPPVPPPDTTPPDAPTVTSPTSFDFATTSIAFAGTAEATSTVTLLVFDGASTSALLFDVGADGLWNFDTTMPEGTTTLSFTATDEAGNVSSSTDIEIHIALPTPSSLPPAIPWTYGENSLIISEVAWSGTGASSTDEWIEIHNRTSDPIPLDGLTLITQDGNVTIPLSGTIALEAYYVIGASGDQFSNYTPDMVANFGTGLNDGGAHLKLIIGPVENPTIVNEVPLCTDWCGFGALGGMSMSRTYWATGANDWGAWENGVEWFTGTTDRNGNPVFGAPGVGGTPPV